MTTMRVLTAYSMYEVDLANNRVRRLAGLNDPTPRQGPDGEWQQCKDIYMTQDSTLLFVWSDNGDGTKRCTETSHVLRTEEIPSEVAAHA